jgi:hypothetical protein
LDQRGTECLMEEGGRKGMSEKIEEGREKREKRG